ncbi:MAG: hypothetical protein NW701_15510 [Nitrospira sp.]
MSTKNPQHPTVTAQTTQTPFERFKAALATVVSVPKSSLPKTSKKAKK